jgi:hypothetical protein
MASKKRSATPRGKAKASAYPASAVTIAAQNLLNMAIVATCCAMILAGLMAVKHF